MRTAIPNLKLTNSTQSRQGIVFFDLSSPESVESPVGAMASQKIFAALCPGVKILASLPSPNFRFGMAVMRQQRLPNLPPIGILPPNMNALYARNHHHPIQPPHGREVYVRVPVIDG